MSQHSALASLTAQYTDSEDEVETEEETVSSSQASVQLIERPTSSLVPPASSLSPPQEGEGGSQQNESRNNNRSSQGSLGLVSYQSDDLIDDDAVDDHLYPRNSAAGDDEKGEDSGDKKKNIKKKTGKGELENGVEDGKKNGEVETITLDQENNDGIPGGAEGGQSGNNGAINKLGKKRSLIPPEPQGKCDPALQEKFAKMLEKKIKTGLDMNKAIQRNKNFRNPSIYEKLIKYCDIDELGSNYPKTIFDPHEFHESSYYDELAKAQKELMEKREKERKERTKVEFVSGTVKKQSAESETKRKSKWDQRGVMPPLLMTSSSISSQSSAGGQPLTNAASGTKSTVISAFGNIAKKSK